MYRPLQTMLLFLFISCNYVDNKSTPNSFQEISLKLNLPQNGRYHYELSSQNSFSQELKGENTTNQSVMEAGYDYIVNKNTENSFQLLMKYTKFKFVIKNPEGDIEFDAAKASSLVDPSQRIFAAFDKAQFMISVDTLGNVQSLTGYEQIKERMNQLASSSPQALQVVNSTFKQYVNEGFFKQQVEQNFKMFPGKKLKVGDNWKTNISINGGLKLNLENTYTLKTVKDGIAEISSIAYINMTEQPLNVGGYPVIASVKGKQTGKIKIEIATGLPLASESKTNISGKIELKGMQIPVKLETKSIIKRS
jgi:hypothetical protein